jgi:hypothetical protein
VKGCTSLRLGALIFPLSGDLVAGLNRSGHPERPKGSESATHRPLKPPQPQTHPRMNRSGDSVREVPEPRLIASHVLVGLFRCAESGLGIGIGRHRITDTTKLDQMGIRSSIFRLMSVCVDHGMHVHPDVPFHRCLLFSLGVVGCPTRGCLTMLGGTNLPVLRGLGCGS